MRNCSFLTLVIVVLWAGAAANARYSGGTGEPNDPYKIATPQDLNDIGHHEEDWDKHFILINDVNLAQYTGAQFKIIGRLVTWNDPNNKPFTGVFDGNDNKICNFTWSSTGRNGIGLFGYLGSGGQIKNLGVENVNVKDGTGWRVAGIVGWNNGGTITNCYVTGVVAGCSVIGGVVGFNHYGTITNCYSTGSVVGSTVGGLVGYNYYGTITNCYSTSSVDGDEFVGGLVGFNEGGTITNCYSTGRVTANYDFGGLVGYDYSGQITASFWDIETSDCNTSAGGMPKTTAEMKTISTFTDAGWDFIEIWGIGENQTYPFLLTDPAGDLNHDKKVDLVDLAILASHWLEGP